MINAALLAFITFAGITVFAVLMIKRERDIIEMLKSEGTTVQVPIEGFSVITSYNDNNGGVTTSTDTYYIHYICNGIEQRSVVSYDEYSIFEIGQLVPITYGKGHVRYNIYKKPFPKMIVPGYENRQRDNGMMQGIVDRLFGGNNYGNNGYGNQGNGGYHSNSGININIGNINNRNNQGSRRKRFE